VDIVYVILGKTSTWYAMARIKKQARDMKELGVPRHSYWRSVEAMEWFDGDMYGQEGRD